MAIGKLLPIFTLAIGACVFSGCLADKTEFEWRQAWTATAAFESPESAAISRRHDAIFVSNVSGYEKNRNGFISRLSLAGEVLDLVWIDGLNAPTGLAVDEDTLWAVDFDRLVEIDIPSKTMRRYYPAPDANPLLNDVAIAADGEIFVTGSASNTVYRRTDSALEPWSRDEDLLKYANGIYAEDEFVIVAAFNLIRISRSDRRAEKMGDERHPTDLEGVKPDAHGGLFVSAIGDRPLLHIDGEGRVDELMRGSEFIADFDLVDDFLVAPTSPDTIEAFLIERP